MDHVRQVRLGDALQVVEQSRFEDLVGIRDQDVAAATIPQRLQGKPTVNRLIRKVTEDDLCAANFGSLD